MRARVEHELMYGPYRTRAELAAVVGCVAGSVNIIEADLQRRTTSPDWPVSASAALDVAIRRHRRQQGLGDPHPLQLPWPDDDDTADDVVA